MVAHIVKLWRFLVLSFVDFSLLRISPCYRLIQAHAGHCEPRRPWFSPDPLPPGPVTEIPLLGRSPAPSCGRAAFQSTIIPESNPTDGRWEAPTGNGAVQAGRYFLAQANLSRSWLLDPEPAHQPKIVQDLAQLSLQGLRSLALHNHRELHPNAQISASLELRQDLGAEAVPQLGR